MEDKIGNGVSNETCLNTVYVIKLAIHRLLSKSYRNSIVTSQAFTGCYRVEPLIDRQESGLRRLSTVTHRGQAGRHRISTVGTADAGLLRFRLVEIRSMPENLR